MRPCWTERSRGTMLSPESLRTGLRCEHEQRGNVAGVGAVPVSAAAQRVTPWCAWVAHAYVDELCRRGCCSG